MKNRRTGILLVLVLVMSLLFTVALTSCNNDNEEDSKTEISDELVGNYYFDAKDGVYTLVLNKDGTASFKVNGENLSGNFTVDGKELALTLNDESVAEITAENGALRVKYKDEYMTFLPDTDYTVTFNTKGGTEVASVTVKNGRKLTLPTAPTRDHYEFLGWCTDADCKNDYNYNTEVVTGNITLYAKWGYVNEVNDLTYVNDDKIKTENAIAKVTESMDFVLEVPTILDKSFAFDGWFTKDGVRLTDETGKSLEEWDPSLGNIEVVAHLITNFTYEELADGTYRVSGSVETITLDVIEIPAMYKGKLVTELGKFEGYANATKVILPASVKYIEEGAFLESTLLSKFEVTTDGVDNPAITAEDGVIFTADKTELILYPVAKSATEYTIPATVVKIANRAFYEINVGEDSSPEFIGNLEKVVMPKNLTYIGEYAFFLRGKLHSVIFDDTATLPLTIGTGAFKFVPLYAYNAEAQTGFKIPNNTVEIGNAAFQASTVMYSQIPNFDTNLVLPEGLKKIGDSAFETHMSMLSVTFPSTLEYLGSNVFTKCYALGSATFHKDCKVEVMSEGLFANTSLSEIVFPDAVKEIASNAFGSTRFSELVLPGTITTIGDKAFAESGLRKINIPKSVVNFGKDVFAGCGSLNIEDILFEEGNTIAVEKEGVIYSKDMKQILIFPSKYTKPEYIMPDTVEEIPSSLFYNNRVTTKVVLSAALKTISANAFERSYIKEIIIPANVERIEIEAFSGASKLESVIFAEGSKLKHIAESAFYGCRLITDINLPEGLLTVGNEAFKNCGFSTFTFPDSVEKIGEDALAGDRKTVLTTVVLPANLQTLGDGFVNSQNNLTTVTIADTNTVFKTVEGVLYTADGTKIVYYPENKEGTEFTVPAEVVEIGKSAFYSNNNLVKINLANVTTIRESAFGVCANMTEFDLSKVTTLEEDAFITCEKVEKVILSPELKVLPNSAFYNNSSLTTIDISNVEKLGDEVFRGCSSLTSVTLNEKLEVLPHRVFHGCDFREITIPDSVTVIEQGVFSSNKNLAKVVLSKNLVTVMDYVFYGNESLKEIVFPDSVENIGKDVFDNCTSLEKATLSKNLKEFNPAMFRRCSALKQVIIPEDNNVIVIKDNTIYSKDMKTLYLHIANSGTKELVVDSNVEEIFNKAFDNANSLVSITLPKGLKNFDPSWFSTCKNLQNINFDKDHPDYKSVDGVVYSKDGTKIVAYVSTRTSTTFNIPDEVVEIPKNAFKGNKILTTVTGGKGLVNIGDWAFCDCSNLESIDLSSVVKVGRESFKNCTKLTSVNFTSSIEEIGKNAFESCVLLADVNLKNVKRILDRAFWKCSSLKVVEMSDVEEIGSWAFDSCKIENLLLPDSLTKAGRGCFTNNDLYTVKIGSGLAELPWEMFQNSPNLKEIIIPNTVTKIGYGAFQYDIGLTTVTIPKSVTFIDKFAFSSCRNITHFVVEEGNTAYKTVDGNLYTIDGKTFVHYAYAKPEDTFRIIDGVEVLTSSAFDNNVNRDNIEPTALKHLILGKDLKQIDANTMFTFVYYTKDENGKSVPNYLLDDITITNQTMVDTQLFANNKIFEKTLTLKFTKDLKLDETALKDAGYVKQADSADGLSVYTRAK